MQRWRLTPTGLSMNGPGPAMRALNDGIAAAARGDHHAALEGYSAARSLAADVKAVGIVDVEIEGAAWLRASEAMEKLADDEWIACVGRARTHACACVNPCMSPPVCVRMRVCGVSMRSNAGPCLYERTCERKCHSDCEPSLHRL